MLLAIATHQSFLKLIPSIQIDQIGWNSDKHSSYVDMVAICTEFLWNTLQCCQFVSDNAWLLA